MSRMQIIDRASILAKEAIMASEDRLIFDSILKITLQAEGIIWVEDEIELLPGALPRAESLSHAEKCENNFSLRGRIEA